MLEVDRLDTHARTKDTVPLCQRTKGNALLGLSLLY